VVCLRLVDGPGEGAAGLDSRLLRSGGMPSPGGRSGRGWPASRTKGKLMSAVRSPKANEPGDSPVGQTFLSALPQKADKNVYPTRSA